MIEIGFITKCVYCGQRIQWTGQFWTHLEYDQGHFPTPSPHMVMEPKHHVLEVQSVQLNPKGDMNNG